MPHMNRRAFLRTRAMTGGAVGLSGLATRAAHATQPRNPEAFQSSFPGLGELIPTATQNTGKYLRTN